MPTNRTIVQIGFDVPGYRPMSAELELPEGQTAKLDDVAIQAHSLVNDIVQSIRKNKVVIDGREAE